MGQVETALKHEINRIARREARALVLPLKDEIKRLKARHLQLKSIIETSQRRQIEEKTRAKIEQATTATPDSANRRLSPGLIRKLRARLGISQAKFGKLVDASLTTIVNWETGKSTPRAAARQRIVALRALSRRDIKLLLDKLAASTRGSEKSAARPKRRKTKRSRRK